jgi:6-phosphogluconolactonase/glucosamine-6-phosphate isomerase/deaminase
MHVPDSPKPPADRITLTRRALETAKTSLLVAIGEPKREALTRLIGGDASLPAWGLPGLVIVTDLDLAR